jgi:hypothetical protein
MAHPMIGLARWVSREEWQEELAEVVAEHLGAACEDDGVAIDELEDVIGKEAFVDAWGAACEDFITRELEDGRNVAENYLKRRGWKESPANREYIKALRHSVVSLYEVLEVEPGRHFTLRDLIRGGEPIRVDEPDRSRHVRPNDLLGARVFRVRQRVRTSETVLGLSVETAEEIEESLADWTRQAKERAPEIAAELGRPDDAALLEELICPEVVLQGAAPLFTDLWLREILDEVFATPPPRIVNSDGDSIELATAVYTLADGVTDAGLDAAFAGLPCVENAPPPPEAPMPETGDNSNDGWTIIWHWVDDTATPDPDAIEKVVDEEGIVRLDPRSVSGLPVLGYLARQRDSVRLAANTMARLERGRALLEPVLAGLVGPPVVELRSMADFLGEIFESEPDDGHPANDDRPD